MQRLTATILTILVFVETCIAQDFLFASPQNILQPGLVPGTVLAENQPENLAHPAVVRNSVAESQLPSELQNPFYKNPAIAAGLAKESWFTNKEFPVHHREAEKISRSQIYKLVQRLQHRRRR